MKLYFALSIIFLLVLTSCSGNIQKVCFEDKCFNVEVVDTMETRQQGLMNRESMPINDGMLFIFDEVGNYPFWMKNTLIPLDMIWMNKNKEIVFIAKGVRPCEADPCLVINPNTDALYVLEINSGLSETYGLRTGLKADFK